MEYPSCCGSEDGEIVVGVDPGQAWSSTVATVWCCNTCGTFSVLKIEEVSRETSRG